MLQNYRSWLTFIHDVLGCLVTLRDIVLVTGCDLTAEWATATFVEKSSQCEIEFKASDPTMLVSGSAAVWGTWQSSIRVPSRCGPGSARRSSTALATNRRDGELRPEGEDTGGPPYNQCIFVRGFRVSDRKLLAPRIIRAAADPNDLDMDRDGDIGPVIVSLEDSSDSDEYGSEFDTSAGYGRASSDEVCKVYRLYVLH